MAERIHMIFSEPTRLRVLALLLEDARHAVIVKLAEQVRAKEEGSLDVLVDALIERRVLPETPFAPPGKAGQWYRDRAREWAAKTAVRVEKIRLVMRNGDEHRRVMIHDEKNMRARLAGVVGDVERTELLASFAGEGFAIPIVLPRSSGLEGATLTLDPNLEIQIWGTGVDPRVIRAFGDG